jgi:hypothetical protein
MIKSKRAKNGPKTEFILGNSETVSANIFEASGESTPFIGGISNEERHHLIAEAAYFRAEQRRFIPGHELEDWLGAEAEVERRLTQSSMDSLRRQV